MLTMKICNKRYIKDVLNDILKDILKIYFI